MNRPHEIQLPAVPLGDLQISKIPISELFARLHTSSDGLTGAEAGRRLLQFGLNDAAIVRRSPLWIRLRSRFQNPLVIVLLLASTLSAFTGDVASFGIITSIVLLSLVIDFFQERRAENIIAALRQRVAVRASVRRDERQQEIPVQQLVPGDLAYLSAGDLVPADGRLFSARDFFVNEALLTGEPYPVEKHVSEDQPAVGAQTNIALAGSSVVSGTASILICRTGRATALGHLAEGLITKAPSTAFEVGLHRFSTLILRITGLLVIFVLAESLAFQRPWLESLMFALALAVGLTPELLPMIVTVTLARGAERLAKQRVVVKRLSAIHNLGAMDVLCTDKTGTLTEAKIVLMRHIDTCGKDSERVFKLAYINGLFETGLKSPLDEAILAHGTFDTSTWRKIDEVPFDFGRRRVSILADVDGERVLVVKGAPEDVLHASRFYEAGDGSVQPVTSEVRNKLRTQFEELGLKGLRSLGIAHRSAPVTQNTAQLADESHLVFVGFVVFLDPPKSSAVGAVRGLSALGVGLKVLTGDNERVGSYLWSELGLTPTQIITGPELSTLSEEALLARLPQTGLFCRVTPDQKLRILLALKRSGQTVGFVGDGVNDAPALHAADVGISVDNGADVAKVAAEIVLLDKDLAVIRSGVLEGRRTVINVDKYIRMGISANFGNIISMAIAGLALPFLPLLPIQVLLTNLLYDIAQFGLPFDNVDPEAVTKPIHWDLRVVERFMLVMGPVSTIFDLITFGVLIVYFQADEGLFRTGWFIESLITQILMIFAVRTWRGIFNSWPHPIVTELTLILAAVSVALPISPIGHWFGFTGLPLAFLPFLLVIVICFMLTVEAAKRGFRRVVLHGVNKSG